MLALHLNSRVRIHGRYCRASRIKRYGIRASTGNNSAPVELCLTFRRTGSIMHVYICINTSLIMRTTLDIPKKLMDEAMKVTGAKTKSQMIKDALQAEIDRVKRKRLISRKGTVDLDIDLDSLRDRR